ncbi:RNA demethylase ALKBH10B-like isoform X1 [Salvia splendens]|uniref:RNA demethylase ALKBH10B-like isoform X1 n=1 Tax=Salvia splendens TaxID=180675 RepID=UPI001C26E680|nr:RNA demethylase ALKBH10B-like isoform X1 [Salvia splendens]
MPAAAGVAAATQRDRAAMKPMVVPAVVQQPQLPMMTAASEAFAKDAIIAWFRCEFAAANAVIDALCSHLTQLEDGSASAASYESAFAAIHRRRLNWIPILQMQKYFSIADVTAELKKVVEKKRSENDVEVKKPQEVVKGDCAETIDEKEKQIDSNQENSLVSNKNGGGEVVDEDFSSEITDTAGSQEVQPFSEPVDICSNHEQCEARRAEIKMTKGFVAKEPVKGHMVNAVRGLKLYEDIFTDTQLSKLNDFVNELRVAGQNGELSGETFILYNQQTKGNKRELIQLGVPIFGHVKDTFQRNYIEPIPALLEGVIDHLIQWRLLPNNRKPNSCIINFFDEGEYSQPFLKPPHLEQPLSTLLLSESTMAFGRMLVSDGEGNYRGPLMLSPKEGSLLVMRGNSSDTARHVMCSSPNKRVSITFFRVRAEIESHTSPEMATSSKAMTLWQPGVPMSNNYGPVNMMPRWGIVRSPVVMLAAAPIRPVIVNPRKIQRSGTGVFLPWNVGSRKHAKHLPPRAQRGRFLALPPPTDAKKNKK